MSCPLCRKPSVKRYRPFCSARCRDLDLGNWFKGSYRIEVVESPDGPSEDTEEEEPLH